MGSVDLKLAQLLKTNETTKKPRAIGCCQLLFRFPSSPLTHPLAVRPGPLVPPLAYLHTLANGGRHAERQPPTSWLPPGLPSGVPGASVLGPEPGPEPGRWPCRIGTPQLLGGRGRRRRGQEGVGAAGADAAGASRRRGACRVGWL